MTFRGFLLHNKMSKRLPYFQFEPAEYLTGDIMFCSLASQGLFNQICCLYWQKDCELFLNQAKKRLNNENLFEELINEKIISVENDKIVIKFLDEQFLIASKKSNINSENGKKGAFNRWLKNKDSENIANAIATPLKNNSESIALREDKIKEDKIKEDNILLKKETKKDSKKLTEANSIILPFPENEFSLIWENWKQYKKQEHNFKFKSIISESMALSKLKDLSENKLEKAIKIINQSIENGWKGFFKLETLQNGNTTSNTKPTAQQQLDEVRRSMRQKINNAFESVKP